MYIAASKLIPDSFQQIVPSLGAWVDSLGTDPLAVALQGVFAPLEVLHILGLFLLGCSVMLMSLRLLGVGFVEATPSSIWRNTRWFLHLGVVLAIVSGALMGLSNASKLYNSAVFLWKMIAMVAGIVFSYAVLVPVAKRDGEVTGGVKAGLAVGLLIWLVSIIVLLSKVGGNVGIFHVLFGAVLIGLIALSGAMRWTMVAVVVGASLALQVATHLIWTDNFSDPYTMANKVYMWGLGLFLVAIVGANIFGKNAARDSTVLTRLIGYSAILIWVTVGAGGRWIGLT